MLPFSFILKFNFKRMIKLKIYFNKINYYNIFKGRIEVLCHNNLDLTSYIIKYIRYLK